MRYSHKFRPSQQYSKVYIENQVKKFAVTYAESFRKRFTITAIQFGKQDTRGAPSISLVDQRDCVPDQRRFASDKEMFSFILGWNEAKENA